jgi:hypothetical protein
MSMQFRQKLAYMALGGVLVLAGHVLPGLVVSPAEAQVGVQDAEFDTIMARRIFLRGGGGFIKLLVDEDAASLGLSSPDGSIQVSMMARDEYGWLTVTNRKTDEVISVHTGGDFGVIVRRGDVVLVGLRANDHGGVVEVSDKYGEPEVQLHVNENGDGVIFR